MGIIKNVGLFSKIKRGTSIRYHLALRSAKTFSPLGFNGVPLYYVIKFFFKGIINGAITTRASAVAFSFYLAIVPTLIFLFTLIPYIPVQDFQSQLLSLLKGIMPDYAFHTVETTLTEVLTMKSGGLLSFGFFTALFFSHNGVNSLIDAFNATYHTIETRKFIEQHLIALVLTLLMPILVMIGVILIFFGQKALDWAVNLGWMEMDFTYYLIDIGKWFVVIALFYFCISFLYFLAPAKKEKFRFFSVGSSLATFLIIITSLAFSFYVNNFGQYNTFYGSLGGLIVFLLWIYFNAFGLILGFELNASISSAKEDLNW
ncbi:MAG TPA: YihY/virulence factor BrkB family protein [Bacteroidales bacterium]|nr:YihY/virulence factor BrkB family protein [Bacteroidales bacterium]